MTKFVEYMILYGSAMNCYGGPGEANHKIFVKAAGQKIQWRICEFAWQTAHQYYYMILTNYAIQFVWLKPVIQNSLEQMKQTHLK